MKYLSLTYLFVIICSLSVLAQNKTQTIRGTIIDRVTRQPVVGASITVVGTTQGGISDVSGNFSIPNVSIGRRAVKCTSIGYETFSSEEFILNSVREVVLTIDLKESTGELQEVKITASQNTSRPVNDLAYVSARSFTTEETERIPASVNDPGRMAISYPGVKAGRDETENKIIVRGNSPFGILWRLEGIDIPNPNHFAQPGSGGGGITVFSAQLMSRSDFFTGGMPAEYGNALSGAFDIRFREGNQQKRQYRTKIGVLGLDFSTEGAIQKGRSSYLVNYRYSTLGLLSQMGIYLVGERVTNNFQDLSFNLAFHSKDGKKTTTIFGLGGLSKEHYMPVEDPEKRVLGKSDNWEDRIRPANMGAVGVTYNANLNAKSSLKLVIAAIGSSINRTADTLNRQNVPYRYETQKYEEARLATSAAYNYKFSSKTRLKAGAIINFVDFTFFKETAPRTNVSDINQFNVGRQTSVNGSGNTQTGQAYAQIVQNVAKGLTMNAGLHFMYLFLNKTSSLEPRFSIQYRSPNAHSVSFAYGLHSQFLPMSAYFYVRKDSVDGKVVTTKANANLQFPRSNHFILSYNYITPKLWKFSIEAYYQLLNRVPVEPKAGSTYWMLNYAESFPETPTVSQGKGKNKGIDMSIERFFSKKYYLLITGSIFDAKYQTFDGSIYNSAFNDRFSTALTFGREFTFKNGSVFQVGGRSIFNGGYRYTPIDEVESAKQKRYVALKGADYSAYAPNYFRIDGRVSYRSNRKNTASVFSLDMQNVTNHINYTSVQYNSVNNKLEPRKSGSGLVPILSYQLDF
ncbi:prevent-host-death protein [Emticicia aquatilis]|uniref:Prevent-host-death protein n=1 Tax=Emticicia aquatilis TaxID=1537369 RepID=A0A916Z290_9BACT|nr:TonB-dependent receptor [Emticicia aquatilis]GGD70185.1 prevent-host-death protein [Emticicia aquatilis]